MTRLIQDYPIVSVFDPPEGYPADLPQVRILRPPEVRVSTWQCPTCSRHCWRLHFVDGQWRCRLCSGLRTPQNPNPVYRARSLRRRLGLPPDLFAPIPARVQPKASYRLRHYSPRWRETLRELHLLEAVVALGLVHQLNASLERYLERDAVPTAGNTADK